MRNYKPLITLIFLAFMLSLIKPASTLCMRAVYPLRYNEYIEKYSKEYNLNKYLVMALIKAESNYIYDAHSGVARGLMQITDETAIWISNKLSIDFSTDDLENPQINIKMGCYYLSYLLDYYNRNETLALSAYNAGLGNVNKWLSDKEYSKDGKSLDKIPFEETRNYLKKINEFKKIYNALYQKEE